MGKGKIAEVFSSIQGEGIYAGAKQLFVRFYGCNLPGCRFCDTNMTEYREYDAHQLLGELLHFKENYHSISITGGEPLLQKDFLKEFLPLPKAGGKLVYLETNGTLPEELGEVIDFTDIIAMDFKLPSSTGLGEFWQVHEAFLQKGCARTVFVKAVITSATSLEDVAKTRDIIAGINRHIPLVLQPVTAEGGVEEAGAEKLQEFKTLCQKRLKRVRIVPQLHKMAGVK